MSEMKDKYCPLIYRPTNETIPADAKCKEEKCIFFRKGWATTDGRGQHNSCWILDGFIGLARTWEIRE